MLTALIFWIVVGLIASALAKWMMPRPDPGGTAVTIIIGTVGAVIGGFILRAIDLGGGGIIWSIIGGFIGAVILLLIIARSPIEPPRRLMFSAIPAMSSVVTHPKPEGGRAEPCPHTRVWVSCEEDGYVGQCVKCAAWGPERESYEEAKLALDEVWGTKA